MDEAARTGRVADVYFPFVVFERRRSWCQAVIVRVAPASPGIVGGLTRARIARILPLSGSPRLLWLLIALVFLVAASAVFLLLPAVSLPVALTPPLGRADARHRQQCDECDRDDVGPYVFADQSSIPPSLAHGSPAGCVAKCGLQSHEQGRVAFFAVTT
jgi:hypothetical protein